MSSQEEEETKAEEAADMHNASRGIKVSRRQITGRTYASGVTDINNTDLDLTKIKPLYENVLIVEDLNAATADSNHR